MRPDARDDAPLRRRPRDDEAARRHNTVGVVLIAIFAADDPLVLNGTYDTFGFKPNERRAYEKHHGHSPVLTQPPRSDTMRLFDVDQVGLYLDTYSPRKVTTGETEVKLLDLTLRLQPLTPELATALDPDLRALIFTLTAGEPKPKLRSLGWALPVPKQHIDVYLLPEMEPQMHLVDCEVRGLRVRREKGIDGFALVFDLSVGPLGERENEQILEWYTQQRFVTFVDAQPVLAFDGAEPPSEALPPPAPRRGRRPNGAEATP